MKSVALVRKNSALIRWANVTPLERFIKYLRFYPDSDCWIWGGAINIHGYGQFHDSLRKQNNVHAFRWSYEYFIGPIANGLHLDHLCRIRACVNPYHLEPVTLKENNLRGISPAAINARKVECKHGHNNWAITKIGRRCKDCHVINEIRRQRLRRLEAKARASK